MQHLAQCTRQNFNDVWHPALRLPAQIADGLGVNGEHPQHRQQTQLPATAQQHGPGGDDAVGPAAVQEVHGNFTGSQPRHQIGVDHGVFPRLMHPVNEPVDVQNVPAQQEHHPRRLGQTRLQPSGILHRRKHRVLLQHAHHGMAHGRPSFPPPTGQAHDPQRPMAARKMQKNPLSLCYHGTEDFFNA